MVRNDIKNSSLLKTKFLIYAFNGRTLKEPCINASFLQGKKWMLDYKRRRLLILDSE